MDFSVTWFAAWFGERVVFWIPFVLSLSVHEYAHARAASWFGDNTAESQGRLTLDPFSHIDLVGTLALPLLGVPIGWARPVPVNPANFRGGGDGRLAMLLTAAAGPLSNVLIALGCTAMIAVLGALAPGLVTGAFGGVLASTVVLNVALALFNLLPIPPLDGSRVVDWLCPDWLRPLWSALYARAGLGIALVLIVPVLLGLDLGGWARALGQGLIDLAL
ncbi:MAG: site-2 protease family protein [Pseudomonadota bacterium]|nr:site-2 protease family protein [Pseudomonadota bacterium]